MIPITGMALYVYASKPRASGDDPSDTKEHGIMAG